MPFTSNGLIIAVNLAALWLVLEIFDFQPFAPRPPWRTPFMELVMWLLLCTNAVLLVTNLSVWLIVTFRGD
jgi:hypothetical protein